MRSPAPYLVCEQCDTVYARTPLGRRQRLRCPCCRAVIARHCPLDSTRLLALALAALILFMIANIYPIMTINIQGNASSSSLWEAIAASYAGGHTGVATLAASTIFFAPLIEILTLIHVLINLRRRQRPMALVSSMTVLKWLRPWGMIDVFLLGTLVTVAKIGDLATVIPGIGLFAFSGLTVVIVAMQSITVRDIWDMADEALA